MSFHSIKEREMKFQSMWEKKCASRRVEGSSKRKFIKKGKDSSRTEMCKCIEARKKSRECIKMTENH